MGRSLKGLRKRIDNFNEEHMVEDTRAVCLIRLSDEQLDGSNVNIRIPYEELDHLQCTTVDSLLLLASGLRPQDCANIINKRYKIESHTPTKVLKARQAHPREFYRMLCFYRDIFLNQQVQSLEQKLFQKLDMALLDVEIDNTTDFSKMVGALKNISEIRKIKEEGENTKPFDKEAAKQLEGNIRAMLNRKPKQIEE